MTGAVMDTEHAFLRGLEGYVAEVARLLGVGMESCTIEPEPPASAYLALDWRLARFPGLDVALLWEERRGWYVALESRTGEDLIALVFYGAELLPAPGHLVRFLADLRSDTHQLGQPGAPEIPVTPRVELVAALARHTGASSV
ncbi:hypothetical protein JOF53_000588 [Crossiella equi]|uniref:DUF6292 domain-containing protein n=1 Tax=Crossiella equi TaxID=130796 RepID=A0ABS5A583_9PSEU|nr:DUF6292 family protein [Crossiella equi]MBP2471716.1 hypothetical protein [Crossiella equi]